MFYVHTCVGPCYKFECWFCFEPLELSSTVTKANVSAHPIRISDILSWDRNSYLTHVISPRLSREDYTLVIMEQIVVK